MTALLFVIKSFDKICGLLYYANMTKDSTLMVPIEHKNHIDILCTTLYNTKYFSGCRRHGLAWFKHTTYDLTLECHTTSRLLGKSIHQFELTSADFFVCGKILGLGPYSISFVPPYVYTWNNHKMNVPDRFGDLPIGLNITVEYVGCIDAIAEAAMLLYLNN